VVGLNQDFCSLFFVGWQMDSANPTGMVTAVKVWGVTIPGKVGGRSFAEL
jgi:hypothetical protein